MKLVILTSDILDGIIVSQRILRSGKDVRAIVYERKELGLKPFLKRLLFRLNGTITHTSYRGMVREKENLVVKEVDNINSDAVKTFIGMEKPELIIVIGTRKLSRDVYGKARLGAINMHTGMLPFYRGADSEFWALYNGEIDKIGVSIHFIDEKLDAGDVLLWTKQKVCPDDDYRRLRMKNILLGAEKMVEAISLIENGTYKRIKQDENLARTYKSAAKDDIMCYKEKMKNQIRKQAVVKEFGPPGFKVEEKVAAGPSLRRYAPSGEWKSNFFCLRLDADEYTPDSFGAYFTLFEKYKDAITIFFNVNSFKNAEMEIKKCKEIGLDIQSHAFYHHTYKDYRSNRHNIRKAKDFFLSLGIETIGFTAPFGWWNDALMQALEDEGYRYSSDFSYDYIGFPSYPPRNGGRLSVLEIPVFPVAPELFYQKKSPDFEIILEYYKNVVDKMVEWNVPVIIYAHTNPLLPQVPALLEYIAAYAEKKMLKGVSMTDFYHVWNKPNRTVCLCEDAPFTSSTTGALDENVLGRPVLLNMNYRIKQMAKDIMDFEKVTPASELRSGTVRRIVKLAARKVF